MSDVILNAYIKNFATEIGIAGEDEAMQYQYFASNLLLRDVVYQEDLSLLSMDVDGSDDAGIDMLAVVVNGYQISSMEELNDVLSEAKRIEVDFVFIQVKISKTVALAGVQRFLSGVLDFFGEIHEYPYNDTLERYYQMKNRIFEEAIKFGDYPKIHLYYVSKADGEAAPDQQAAARTARAALIETRQFSNILIEFVGAREMQSLCDKYAKENIAEVAVGDVIIFPKLAHIEEAVLCTVSSVEFFKLIDGGDKIKREIFFDNVRDYQGSNEVNLEIDSAIRDDDKRNIFPLMNNGITIVANSLRVTRKTLHLIGYQVVNGCQTSNVIFNNKDIAINKPFMIPLKIISSNSSEIINAIIRAANRQTEVKVEAFESLSDFHKNLESYYSVMRSCSEHELYYERRSKQYAQDGISRAKIITLPQLAKAVVSIYEIEPHSDHQYYGAILKERRRRLFLNSHKPEPYYLGGLISYMVAEHVQRNCPDMWRMRPQIMMAVKIIMNPDVTPAFNSEEIVQYCKNVLEMMSDGVICNEIFSRAIRLVRETLEAGNYYQPWREKKFTHDLLARLNVARHHNIETTYETGVMKFYNIDKGYGVAISQSDGMELFVNYKWVHGNDIGLLHEGSNVRFVRSVSRGNNVAIDVSLIR